ncbi:MAG TPA: bifunctional DNA primase/polymerase [Pseudonocardia sp.]
MTAHTRTTRHDVPDLLAAALTAAERGWHVFPLRAGNKQPALHGYDRCPRTGPCAERHAGWEQRATTDPDRIRTAWAGQGAQCNVGIACGPSGLVVIDLDAIKPDESVPEPWAAMPGIGDGQDVLTALAEEATGDGVPTETFTVATASSGLHLYYRAPADVALRNTEGGRGRGVGWKVDTRAHGGYVVAPGSLLDQPGQPNYRVLDDRDPVPLPGWLTDRLAPTPLPTAPATPIAPVRGRSRYLDAAVHGELAKVLDAPASQRNACLYAAAVALGQLVAGGALTDDEVTAALFSAAGKHVALGAYSARQAHQTIASGIRAGATRPRQVAA